MLQLFTASFMVLKSFVCANNFSTRRAFIAESVWEMFGFNMISDMGSAVLCEGVANSTRKHASSIGQDKLLEFFRRVERAS